MGTTVCLREVPPHAVEESGNFYISFATVTERTTTLELPLDFDTGHD